MTEFNIVFLDAETIPYGAEIPRPTQAHNWIAYPRTAPSEVYERVKDADIVLTNKVVLDAELLARVPRLKLICVTATGTNNVDLNAAKAHNIAVKNVAGYSNVSVPEHVIGMIFALRHSFFGYHAQQLTSDRWATCGQFSYIDFPVKDIRQATLGIVGKGALGSEVARLAEAVGMRVIFAEHRNATSVREGYTAFDEVFKTADIITLHCPLTPDTQQLINRETLALMKKSACLINTGRGPLVDEAALLEALEQGQIAGAALDVLTSEPPAIDDPLMQAAKRLPNLFITPHIGWAGENAVKTLVEKVGQNIRDFLAEIA